MAKALAAATGARLVRLQCYEGLEASQALYDWDFGRQLLHLRAAEAAHANQDTAALARSGVEPMLVRPIRTSSHDPSPARLTSAETATIAQSSARRLNFW